jgi:hypothetical protein
LCELRLRFNSYYTTVKINSYRLETPRDDLTVEPVFLPLFRGYSFYRETYSQRDLDGYDLREILNQWFRCNSFWYWDKRFASAKLMCISIKNIIFIYTYEY